MLRIRFRNTPPKERGPSPRRQVGQARTDSGAGLLEAGDANAVSGFGRSRGPALCAAAGNVELCRALAEAAVRHGTQSLVTAPRANIVATSFA
jgi:hypothetical protein